MIIVVLKYRKMYAKLKGLSPIQSDVFVVEITSENGRSAFSADGDISEGFYIMHKMGDGDVKSNQ